MYAADAQVRTWHQAEVFGAAAIPSDNRVTFPVLGWAVSMRPETMTWRSASGKEIYSTEPLP